ncbi:DUF4349 domain-containing protein [Mycolicibacterium sp. F2034L]|uniref:DUF4349 domain-containing protein n=1 Tax=Mycolicibacterium sp. F2034L TaxID=2926422 RepID=UPI001FF5EE78|nr:DUF4349 domain-containing protein [Mycolicibacterium sp. F2034L]MCK0174437.1 DUF4349 domain-containing protein [Mycolicibacterium sp. F2034L]
MIKVSRVVVLSCAVAVFALLSSCAEAPERPADSSGGTAEVVGAPLPQDAPQQAPPVQRDLVKTASMTVTVPDPAQAADKAADVVGAAGGRVDSRTDDAGSGTGRASSTMTLRVPAADLDDALDKLKELGTVERAEISTEDVTAQRVDLDARITALRTSVDRLLAIMRDARDPAALITAEDALSERQAELDSLRAQREALGDRIEYSTIEVSFVADAIGGPAPKEYRGFLGSVEQGWDVMVSVAGRLLLVFGLLVPWLVVVASAAGIGYAVIRILRARRP